jgi:hypothetical protein
MKQVAPPCCERCGAVPNPVAVERCFLGFCWQFDLRSLPQFLPKPSPAHLFVSTYPQWTAIWPETLDGFVASNA